jgi:RimJ/RimL family protein N-acetyltransferase
VRAPGALTAARVTLRPAARNDLPQIQPWYAEAVATAHGLREAPPDGTLERRFSDTEASDAGLLLIAKADDPAPIGLLQYRPGFPDKGWLAIDFLALAAGRRGWGYGSEAVRLVEDWAVDSRKAKRFLAEVDARNGLALYFWLRLGYRPLRPDEVFWRAPDEDGIIAMVRDGM